ncbi:hypothetical protein LMH87_005341 [Akanthomyces muscarius]|uniref:Methyltransferase domain-containing protein n=1 Tax=Akanthomyces muscarius TaxID=2231603 RepID=A0A9W8QNK3_AKAMU|nr:hypothetical protein LMH87_005341 [Akanthomyces muscarius]KAJ4163624.1 hypothetical protein LMH87_005341 [Akanthomyces muscarius]
MESPVPIHVIESDYSDQYQEAMLTNYEDPPEVWEKVLGETLSFNGGLFSQKELAAGPQPGPVGASEFRGINRQLELAGLLDSSGVVQTQARPLQRIMDLGCGWGVLTQHLAKTFPDCPRIDAANLSVPQLQYCADKLPPDLQHRVNLYRCNVQNVDELPDLAVPYDFVFVRGVWFHCLPAVFEASVARVAQRMAPGGILLLSDPLYAEQPGSSSSSPDKTPEATDGVGTEDHKTPAYYTSVLRKNGFQIRDMRVLPSNAELVHWFLTLKLNIQKNFPEYPNGVSEAVRDLHDFAESFTNKVTAGQVSMYSVVARRVEA